MNSTLEKALDAENTIDRVVYDAAGRGFTEIDNWRRQVDKAAEKLGVSPPMFSR